MPFLSGVAICFFSGIGLIHSTLRRRQGEGWAPVLQGVSWKNAMIILIAGTTSMVAQAPQKISYQAAPATMPVTSLQISR
jgi:hypothetical protein